MFFFPLPFSEPVLRHLKCRQSTDINGHKTRNRFPLIKKSSTFTAGLTVPSTVQLSKQKIVVKRLKTKLNLLTFPSFSSFESHFPLLSLSLSSFESLFCLSSLSSIESLFPLPSSSLNLPFPLIFDPPPLFSIESPCPFPHLKVNNIAVTPNATMNSRNSNEMADLTNKNREEKISKTKEFDGLQEKEEEKENEEWTSEITAAVEDKAEDAKNIGSCNQNQDNYQNHLTGNNLKPLTATPLENVPSSEQDILKETFNKLDSDKDGHLLYSQLKSLLPEKFSINQEKFIKEVYNITSQSTFFGISEFWGMTQLTKNIESLSGPALEAYNLLNFDTLNDSISEYLTDFQYADPSFKGNLSLDALCALLSKHTKQNLLTNKASWNQVLSNITLTDTDSIRKTNFLAHIPYFLSLI
ncbi:unnamed protein product [Acanthosepion pharaonis]|uniref:EF-hand domain-containing protein n=1 Tax=Acanthosepion pharaonis TaxID=158019 RepID=A0A812C4U5_ACAPH|nr:unnamed protein product [Sepia pharaonis]